MNLAKINLNLLLSLQALLTEGSVTRAAQRLHVTQSAMSKSLAQLRELIDDPLLVRIDNSTQLTLLAMDLRAQVDAVLQDIEQLLQHSAFDPAACEHGFTLVAGDYESQYLLPQIFLHLHALAPKLSLRLLHLDEHMAEGMAAGRIDLCLTTLEQLPPHSRHQPLYRDQMVCVMSARHPKAGDAFTLEDYCSYPHVVSSTERGQLINDLLASQGLYRPIRLEVPMYHGALRLIGDSDLLVTLPTHIAAQLCANQDMVQVPLPFEVPALDFGLIWPARLDGQASHRWLRETLAAYLCQLMADTSVAFIPAR
ncbi:LysR family transcriptional regulator [Metapseudomonas resinovorans]|nr:LysR family transcriptional regulator [Pseudomonas resinovorans]